MFDEVMLYLSGRLWRMAFPGSVSSDTAGFLTRGGYAIFLIFLVLGEGKLALYGTHLAFQDRRRFGESAMKMATMIYPYDSINA